MKYEESFSVQNAKNCKQGDIIIFLKKKIKYIAIVSEIYDGIIEIIILGAHNGEIFVESELSFICDDINFRDKVISYADNWSITINSNNILLDTDFKKGDLILWENKIFLRCADPAHNGDERNFDLSESEFSRLRVDGCAPSRKWDVRVKSGDDWKIIFSAGDGLPN